MIESVKDGIDDAVDTAKIREDHHQPVRRRTSTKQRSMRFVVPPCSSTDAWGNHRNSVAQYLRAHPMTVNKQMLIWTAVGRAKPATPLWAGEM
jgi:hypothetical protein